MKYTVKAGDSLSKIARDRLGNMELWPEIAMRNGIKAPYVIEVGQVLELTDDPAEAPRPRGTTIVAPVPADAKVPMPAWQRGLMWGGLAAIAAMFLFPPEEGGMFGLKGKSRRRRSRGARSAA